MEKICADSRFFLGNKLILVNILFDLIVYISVVDQHLAVVTMVFSISCSFDSSNLKKEKQHDYIYQPVSSKCAYLPFKETISILKFFLRT